MTFAIKLRSLLIPLGQGSARGVHAPAVDTLDLGPTTMPSDPDAGPAPPEGPKRARGPLPLIGHLPLRRQVKVLTATLGVAMALAFLFMWLDSREAGQATIQAQVVGDSLMHSQRLAKAAPNAVLGKPEAFMQLRDSRDALAANILALSEGGRAAERSVPALSSALRPQVDALLATWSGTKPAASQVLDQEKVLTQLGSMLREINLLNPKLLELAEQVSTLKVQSSAPPREISAAAQLVMLTQRIAKSANQLLTEEALDSGVASQLGKDANTFRELLRALTSGSESLRIAPAQDAVQRNRLFQLDRLFAEFQQSVDAVLQNIERIQGVRAGEARIFTDSETLRLQLSSIQAQLGGGRGGMGFAIAASLMTTIALAAGLLLGKAYVDDIRLRADESERQRQQAERLEQEAKRLNAQNQSAILRLMNELQEVADGDLTVQATVTEDITGAIADSVNYTIEELRSLVGRINATAEMVTDASGKAQDVAAGLLAASERQSREIRDTGESVLGMARQINDVSGSSSEAAAVARHSLTVAENGAFAVENAIAGMNDIRDQIQDTAKRIKRLGESSQEIGEIVELISDITEQTNVLALNAAIQAASAGEAGRGFTVVAEEVQRLAERSGEATRQIAGLIRTIQADTHDAVAAMERSTQNVVEGTRLSDEAGNALGDIGRVSRQLAELIEDISATTSRQAVSAGTVAQAIQRILLVTEQTSDGTQLTATSIRQLSELALELKSSVSRFKVS